MGFPNHAKGLGNLGKHRFVFLMLPEILVTLGNSFGKVSPGCLNFFWEFWNFYDTRGFWADYKGWIFFFPKMLHSGKIPILEKHLGSFGNFFTSV
jgi:hypothetical protein